MQSDRQTGVMNRWLRDPPDPIIQRLHSMEVSDLDNKRLGKTETSATKPRLKRLLAASDMDNERHARTEASTAKPWMSPAAAAPVVDIKGHARTEASTARLTTSPATTASVLRDDRRYGTESSKAKLEVNYITSELVRSVNFSLKFQGLTWDDEIIEKASSVLLSSLKTFADKIGESGNQSGLAFIQKHQL